LRVERARKKIEEQKETALTEIKIKKNETLAKLNTQYKTAVKVKETFGYIGIIFLSLLCTAILLNDLGKLCMVIYERCTEIREEKRQQEEKKNKEKETTDNSSLEIQIDRIYSRDLEIKLDQFHQSLVKAVAASSRK